MSNNYLYILLTGGDIMAKEKGYYSGNSNILETFIDCMIDTTILFGKTFWNFTKWCFDIQPKKDLRYFYDTVGAKNKLGETVEVIKSDEDKQLLKIPVGTDIEYFEKTKKTLETYLNYDVAMTIDNGYLTIRKVEEKKLQENIPWQPSKKVTDDIKINIGESIKGPVTLNLKENPHSYIVGTTGSGKSIATKVILTNLISTYRPQEIEIYLADLKRVELNLFRNVIHCKSFVWTVDDTTDLIADLLEETNRRYDLFMENEVTNIFEYNRLPGVKKLKYQILYIEEIVMLLEDRKRTAMRLLKQLIAISRSSGLYIFLTTQRPSNDVIDNVVKANINNRIAFKCEDSKNSIVALDTTGAESLRGKGHGILKRGTELLEFQGYYISDKEVKEAIKPFIKPKEKKAENSSESVREANNNVVDISWLDNL